MSNIDIPQPDGAAGIELRAIFSYVWDGRKIILLTIGVFVILGLLWYRTAPRIYEATATLSSAPGSSTGNNNANPLSGAARLIGLGGPTGPAGVEYTKFQALLSSSRLADRLEKIGMLQQMYPQQWDQKTHSWKVNRGLLSPVTDAIREILGTTTRTQPSAQDILAQLRGNLDQDLSLQTSLLQLSYSNANPDFAVEFLTEAHREADNILREAARMRSQRRIDYLQDMLKSVTAVEQRAALIQLLDQETQTNMMIQSDPNYSADIVDPPHVSAAPVSPKLPVALITSVVAGFAAGLMLHVLIRNFGLNTSKLRLNPAQWPRAFGFGRH